MYAGLTIADKDALLDAKAQWRTRYFLESIGQWIPIDEALAQIAEMESAEKPLTWNERINQMTVEEKAKFITKMMNASVDSGTGRKSDVVCVDSLVLGARTWLCGYPNCEQCFKLFLASPYTEGATK